MSDASDLALVMGGGGARAAYQVGVLRSIARRFPELTIPILNGVSAGAINTAHLASARGGFAASVEHLVELWKGLTPQQVFETHTLAMVRTAAHWGVRLISGGRHLAPTPRGMVDTEPLRRFLFRALSTEDGSLPGIRHNIASGALRAAAITTTDYATGQSVTHVQSSGLPSWKRPHRYSVETELTVAHVMASAALPLFFPAVQVGGAWHGDGGIGLTAPLAPALHLGAGRILAISTRYEKSQREAGEPLTRGYPPPAHVIGLLLNAVFLDMLDFDALNLDRINRLIEALPEDRRMGLRPAQLLLLRPSENLAALASRYEPRLPQPFRFLMRGTGTRETKSPESLSMVMFEPTYVGHVIELGERDAERHAAEIEAFLAGAPSEGLRHTGFWRV